MAEPFLESKYLAKALADRRPGAYTKSVASTGKAMLAVVAEVLETAVGYALIAAGFYAVLFVDLTGGGSLWRTMRHWQSDSSQRLEPPSAARVITVPALPLVAKSENERMMSFFDKEPTNGNFTALYPAPDAVSRRPSVAFLDAPAEPKSGKTWKRGIRGSLRKFTVYGKGDQTTSATMSGGGAPAPEESALARRALAAEGSPARAETSSVARPGVGLRMSRGVLSASGASRNVR